MKKKSLISVLLVYLLFVFANGQRKAAIVKVDAQHSINGSPFIILPQAAIKMDFSIVQFSYTIGDHLRELIDTTKCNSQELIIELKKLEKEYDVNPDIIMMLLRRPISKDEEELSTYKLDKDIKTSFISVADYTKVFKYINLKGALTSSLLTLEYDDNGVLVSSKQTNEPKLIPTIISAVSAVASIATIFKSSEPVNTPKVGALHNCINKDFTQKLDSLAAAYSLLIKTGAIYNDKQFDKAKEKSEEEIIKEFSDLFYSKEIKIIPLRVTFIIPRGDSATSSPKNLELFSYDKVNKKVIINKIYAKDMIYSPADRFTISSTALSTPYILQLNEVPVSFNKLANLNSVMGAAPEKETAVFNIPKSENVRFLKPSSTEAYMDTIIKVPQHGTLGYLSMRLSTINLNYDTNGELKNLSLEKKSVVDSTITGGASALTSLINATKGKTEMEQLDEKEKKLELLKKIHDLENAPE